MKPGNAEDSLDREEWEAFGFILPLILFLLALILVPVLGALYGSLFRDVPFLRLRFIGLDNYSALFADPAFWKSLRFTLFFCLVSVPLEVILGLLVALLLNESFPMRGLMRACILIPWAIPAVISARIFELIYNYSYGLANYLLLAFHLRSTPVNWLGTEPGAFAAVVLADAWKTTPFTALILLAGLSAIPRDLYWQASVDRAGVGQRFFRITLPLLKPVLTVVFLFRTIQAIQVFDVVYVLTRGGPGGSTMPLSLYGFNYFAGGDFGYGSAVSVCVFLLAFGLAVAYLRAGGFGRGLT